ncbi:VOC family protein [Brevibacillus thermoruber]|uniref:VOC family protein n=1 Tax=Brevibacillus thermoruber TaxID=33942 RepID=UPI004041B6B4
MARVVLFELSSQNPERAVQFYSTVFGWNVAEPRWGPDFFSPVERMGRSGR